MDKLKGLIYTAALLAAGGCSQQEGSAPQAFLGQCPPEFTAEYCRDVLVARASAESERALSLYATEAAERRGYMQAMRDSGAWPSPTGGAR